ncbi:hypothetical protein Tco_0744070 [Tanacetum coccineum]
MLYFYVSSTGENLEVVSSTHEHNITVASTTLVVSAPHPGALLGSSGIPAILVNLHASYSKMSGLQMILKDLVVIVNKTNEHVLVVTIAAQDANPTPSTSSLSPTTTVKRLPTTTLAQRLFDAMLADLKLREHDPDLFEVLKRCAYIEKPGKDTCIKDVLRNRPHGEPDHDHHKGEKTEKQKTIGESSATNQSTPAKPS